jgi:preprotein translocase subunit SecA
MNAQREVVYAQRREILEGHDLRDKATEWVGEVVEDVVATYCPPEVFPEEWDLDQLLVALAEIYPLQTGREDIAELKELAEIQGRFVDEALEAYEAKEEAVTAPVMRELERVVLLNITDTKWREHLYEMDYLQEGIHLRAYAQRDPLTEYRREAFEMFEDLIASIRQDFVRYIYRVEFVRPEQQQARPQRVADNRGQVESGGGQAAQAANPNQARSDKVPRNAPCPCGSGKKYKKCHGAAA